MTRSWDHALALVVGAALFGTSAAADVTGPFDAQIPCITQPGGVRYCGGSDTSVPTWNGVTSIDHYTLNRKWMMSPSWTTYSLPSSRSFPASRHFASLPRRTKSS